MRILLFGCTGFIGKELIPKLIQENHKICVVSRQNIDNLELKVSFRNINFLKLDITRKENWLNENLINNLKNSEAIINLMGEPIADKRWTIKQKKIIEKSRVDSTLLLMENLKNFQIKPKIIINASAIGFYGTSLNKEFNENSPKGNDFLANLCEKWEEAAFKKPFFTRLVIFRIGIVIDSEGGALKKMLPIFKAGLGGPIGNGNQWMSWIHRSDICGLIINALKDKKYNGIINAVAPETVNMKKFSNILAKCLNRPNFLPVPAITLKLLLGDGSKLVLEGQNVKSIKIKNNFYQFKYPNLQDAIAAATKK